MSRSGPARAEPSRTPLFTPSDSAGVWSSSINSAPLEVALTESLDSYLYITISAWYGYSSSPKWCITRTLLRSEIPVDSSPSNSESVVWIDNYEGGIYLGRNTAGNVLYISAGSPVDTGKIMGIWGGDF